SLRSPTAAASRFRRDTRWPPRPPWPRPGRPATGAETPPLGFGDLAAPRRGVPTPTRPDRCALNEDRPPRPGTHLAASPPMPPRADGAVPACLPCAVGPHPG